MGKKVKTSTFSDKSVAWYEDFKGLRNQTEGWSIVYDPNCERLNLTFNDQIKHSDASISAVQYVAEQRHNLPLDSWRQA